MITARPLGASYMENETQVATLGSINVYARLGFRYLRSTSTYHLRLDGADRVRVIFLGHACHLVEIDGQARS